MNYDKIAAMKVDELRKEVRQTRDSYNKITNQNITFAVIRNAPKARLLYMLCRYLAEIDTRLSHKREYEDLAQREANVAEVIKTIPPEAIKAPKEWRIKGTFDWRHTNNVDVTIEEVN